MWAIINLVKCYIRLKIGKQCNTLDLPVNRHHCTVYNNILDFLEVTPRHSLHSLCQTHKHSLKGGGIKNFMTCQTMQKPISVCLKLNKIFKMKFWSAFIWWLDTSAMQIKKLCNGPYFLENENVQQFYYLKCHAWTW